MGVSARGRGAVLRVMGGRGPVVTAADASPGALPRLQRSFRLHEPAGMKRDGQNRWDDVEYSKASAELRLIRASDGKVLLQGTGFGESDFRAGKGVVRKIFRQILKEAFGAP